MDKVIFKYSHKDIPIHSNKSYLIKMMDMTSKFINKMRWKVYWHEKQQNIDSEIPTPGSTTTDQTDFNVNKNILPSKRSAPTSGKITAFENDLFSLCKNLKFKKNNCKYQSDLIKSIEELKEKRKVIVKAYKTSNLYKVDVDLYKKTLMDNITAKYKKAPI